MTDLILKNGGSAEIYRWMIENMLYIVNKDRIKVRFRLNEVQLPFLRGMGKRNILLKARQQGFSSIVLAKNFMDCITIPYTTAVVVTQDKDETQRMLDRVHFYLETMRASFKNEIKTDLSNRQMIRFTNTGSSFYIGTAGSKSFGRGDTISRLHISELSVWENTEVLTGLLEAVPDSGEVVIESTANGLMNMFHYLWEASERGEKNYKTFFFAWFEYKEYRRAVEGEFVLDSDEVVNKMGFETEASLVKRFGLTNEQLNWRRWKIRDMPDPSKWPQEYPADPMEAFLFSGNNVFDKNVLTEWYKVDNKFEEGVLRKNKEGDIVFEPATKGMVRIYKRPEHATAYRIGADVAEGIENELKDRDWSVGSVKHGKTWEQVAKIRVRCDPDEFADYLDLLGRFYNNAKLGVEINNHGFAVLSTLQRVHKYPNLYYKEVLDELSKKKTKKFGWKTDMKTKPLMIADQKEAIRERVTRIVDKDTIREHLSYIMDNEGKYGAAPGSHDDEVIADTICTEICKLTPYYDLNIDWSKKQFNND